MNVKRIVVAATIGAAALGVAVPAAASAQVLPHHGQAVVSVHDQAYYGVHDQVAQIGVHDQAQVFGVHDQALMGVHDQVSTGSSITSTPSRDLAAVLDGLAAAIVFAALGAVMVRRRSQAAR
jgi:hypothetical protein